MNASEASEVMVFVHNANQECPKYIIIVIQGDPSGRFKSPVVIDLKVP